MKPFARTTYIYYLMTVVVILSFWLMSSLSDKHIIPSIAQVSTGFVDLWNEGLLTHIFASLSLFFIVLPIAAFISVIIGYMSLIPTFKPFAIFISKLRFLPLTGITFYISMLGIGARATQIWILVIFMSTYLITSLVAVFTSIETEEINHAKTLGLNRWEVMWELVIRGRLDYVIESIRQNFSIIWLMLVTVESLLVTTGGIGFLIKNSDKFMNLGKVIALQLIILFIGILLDYAITQLRKSAFKYSLY